MRIAIAGASGFVGRLLSQELGKNHEVFALSRNPKLVSVVEGQIGPVAALGVYPKRCNLFSLLQVEEALAGCDVGVYLVHSMLPPSRLTQGNFSDIDLILADNFARAAKSQGLQRIVYLGGIIPDGPLSKHLLSRLETEQVLSSYSVPVVSLRAGLVIGPNGSSFQIVEKLVKRLPLMVCPAWTENRSQPVDVNDVVKLLSAVVSDRESSAGTYDIGGPDMINYRQLMQLVARGLKLRRYFVSVSFFSLALSKLWVRLITQSPKALVYPLIDSLRHEMLPAKPLPSHWAALLTTPLKESIDRALQIKPAATKKPNLNLMQKLYNKRDDSMVMSVQRIDLPGDKTIHWLVDSYVAFLRRTFLKLIDVRHDKSGSFSIFLRPNLALLNLTLSEKRSTPSRQLFYVTGGLLSHPNPHSEPARLEFRKVPGKTQALIAVLNFRPRLPWWLYRPTQAQLHLLLMNMFRRYVRRNNL